MTSVIRVQTGDSTHDISTKGCDDRQSGKSRQLLWMESLSTKNEFFHCLFQRLMKKITASSSRAGARVPYALFELPVESGRRKSHWQQPRYLTGSHSALLLLHCLSYSSDSVAPQQKRAAALKPLSQTIFSRTTTETQPAAHSKAINGGKMAFKLLCCRLPVFTFNLSFHFVVF